MQAASGFAGPPESTLKRLFKVQENLVLLGGAVLLAIAFASPVPLLLGAAGELLWLALGASSPGVRRLLERRRAAAPEVATSPPVPVAEQPLAAEYASRVIALKRALATIRAFGGARPPATFEFAMNRLATLEPTYVALCGTHQRIGSFLAGTNEEQFAVETERLKQQFASEKDLGTRLTLRQAIVAAQRHVEHRRNMTQLRRSIEVKLESVERSLAYLVSQGLALVSNPELPDEIDALLVEAGPALEVNVEGRPESTPAPP